MLNNASSILALDVGGRRIGVAAATTAARLAHPLTKIENNADVLTVLRSLMHDERAVALVVGLPRGMSGQATEQTRSVEAFVDTLKQYVGIPIHMQDEAVTSRQAEAELRLRNKPYDKADIDALAATYILDDYLNQHPEVRT